MPGGHGTDTEVGRLRTVLVHRPGAELSRITPGNCAAFPFGRVPWLSRAQQEHDQFTGALRDHGVDVLYLTELLQDVLEYPTARHQVAAAVQDGSPLGAELDGQLRSHLDGLDPEALCRVLITGLARDEFRDGRGAVHQGGNTLVTGPRRAIAFERAAEASARLEEAGLAVTRVPGHELGGDRGGPRGLACPVSREPAELPEPRSRPGAGPWPPAGGQEPPTRVDQQRGTSDPGVPIEAAV